MKKLLATPITSSSTVKVSLFQIQNVTQYKDGENMLENEIYHQNFNDMY